MDKRLMELDIGNQYTNVPDRGTITNPPDNGTAQHPKSSIETYGQNAGFDGFFAQSGIKFLSFSVYSNFAILAVQTSSTPWLSNEAKFRAKAGQVRTIVNEKFPIYWP